VIRGNISGAWVRSRIPWEVDSHKAFLRNADIDATFSLEQFDRADTHTPLNLSFTPYSGADP